MNLLSRKKRSAVFLLVALTLFPGWTAAEHRGRALALSEAVLERVAPALTARQALAAMNAGWMTSSEYIDVLLHRIEAHPEINAFIQVDAAGARQAAADADARRARGESLGPLDGLPVIVKDSINTDNMPTTAGTPTLAAFVPAQNAPVLQALLDAGAFVLGKTNLHELSLGYTTNNAFTGAARNPYDLDRIPGGSSGGNGAALAARFAPVALGEDTGGSVRVPAAMTGTVGFRPTTGRYPGEGVVPLASTFDTVGPMGRDVGDLALIDAVITGELDELPSLRLRDLRIGVPSAYFRDLLDPEVEKAFDAALDRLARLGATLVPADIPVVDEQITLFQGFGAILFFEARPDLTEYLQVHGTGVSFEQLVAGIASPDVAALFAQVVNAPPPEPVYLQVLNELIPFIRASYLDYLDANDLDAVAYPTAIITAPRIGQQSVEVDGVELSVTDAFIRHSHYAPVVGAPTLSLPLGQSKAGLPVGGMDVAARPGEDRRLLAIGKAISGVLPTIRPPKTVEPRAVR